MTGTPNTATSVTGPTAELGPQAHDWDNPTDAEFAADIWHREHSRGRHGIREWPRTEPFRVRETERAQAVLDALARRKSRQVETAEELDALPVMTVVRETLPRRATGADFSRVWEKWYGGEWIPVGGRVQGDQGPTLPSAILWHPKES